jgi:hypothetical protein
MDNASDEQYLDYFAGSLQDLLPYVDKTGFFPLLYKSFPRDPVFLARPRRFGKTLLVSSLDAFFSGRTDLFHGLQAEPFMNSPDFMARPVIHLDMSKANALSGIGNLNVSIFKLLDDNASRHGARLTYSTVETRFDELISKVASASPDKKCVLLIDEYDSPVVSLTQKDRKFWNLKLMEDTRDVMRPFYRTIKSLGGLIRFTLLTGVTKFSKMGVFSELNNLIDLSLSPEYATLCGFTQDELEK